MRERQRITIDEARPLIGLPVRTVQKLSAIGEIPGAAKMGRRWTFDVDKLERWIAHKERETWQNAQKRRPGVIGGDLSFGQQSRSMGVATAGRFTQTIQRLLDNDRKQARLALSLTSGTATASDRSKKRSSLGKPISLDKSAKASFGRKLKLVTSAQCDNSPPTSKDER